MKYVWQDLPKPLNCLTVRNATMVNLNTGKIVNNYPANTKIVVVQKCVTPKGTYYRTNEAAYNYLNYAFRASAFGLPNEKAPSEHSTNNKSNSSHVKQKKSGTRTPPIKKTKICSKHVTPEDGEERRHKGLLSRLFRRKNG